MTPRQNGTRQVLRGAFVLLAVVGWTACAGPDDSSDSRDLAGLPGSGAPSDVVGLGLRLDALECLDQNDASGADDEVFVRVSWEDPAADGSSQLPADGGRWRMCGANEFEPSELLQGAIRAGDVMTVHFELGEDDSQADRVSNQIDDVLAHFSLEFSVEPDGTLRAVATPLPVEDNNAMALLPLVELDLNNEARTIAFRSVYRNADGGVHYEGALGW